MGECFEKTKKVQATLREKEKKPLPNLFPAEPEVQKPQC
jgi:hypothetical protein